MPRAKKGKGGARTSSPGTLHANRTDMVQAPKAKTGQTYGEAGRQIAAQQAAPLPAAAPTPTPGAGGGPPPGAGGSPLDMLQGLPGLADPSIRPDEPLTAGLPFGPGQSPPPTSGDPTEGLLRAMIAAGNSSPVLFDLLARAEAANPRNAMAMMPSPGGKPGNNRVGIDPGVAAGSLGAPTGTMFGRIASREGQQMAAGSPDTTEG